MTGPLVSWLVLLAALTLPAAGCATTRAGRPSDVIAIDRVLDLVKTRLDLAPAVARTKWNSGAPIEDLVREQDVIDAAAARAAEYGVERGVVEAFFRAQIEASKVVQRSLHAEWTGRQQGTFPVVPSLDRDIRPVLDRVTPDMLRALAAVVPVLRQPGARQQLARRSGSIVTPTPGSRRAVDVAVAPLLALGR